MEEGLCPRLSRRAPNLQCPRTHHRPSPSCAHKDCASPHQPTQTAGPRPRPLHHTVRSPAAFFAHVAQPPNHGITPTLPAPASPSHHAPNPTHSSIPDLTPAWCGATPQLRPAPQPQPGHAPTLALTPPPGPASPARPCLTLAVTLPRDHTAPVRPRPNASHDPTPWYYPGPHPTTPARPRPTLALTPPPAPTRPRPSP